MDCKYHRGKKAVGQCKLCGAKLCQKCTDFQQQYGRCPACAKDYLQYVYKNFKRGLRYNIFGVVCAVAFLALYIVCFCTNNADKQFVIFGAIVIAVLTPLSIFLLVYSCKQIKKCKQNLMEANGEFNDFFKAKKANKNNGNGVDNSEINNAGTNNQSADDATKIKNEINKSKIK